MSYLSDGTKVVMTYGSGKSLRYIGSLVYEKQSDGTFRIESVPFSNGRFVASHTSAGTSFDAQRHLTDDLGSVRCIVNSAGLVIEMNDYTPYGERFSVPSYPRSSNRYLFNGKEEVLAGLLDYGARIYDPYTRRWLTQDPLAEKYYSSSPYTYCANNPIRYIDPNGMDIWDINRQGQFIYKGYADPTILSIEDDIPSWRFTYKEGALHKREYTPQSDVDNTNSMRPKPATSKAGSRK